MTPTDNEKRGKEVFLLEPAKAHLEALFNIAFPRIFIFPKKRFHERL